MIDGIINNINSKASISAVLIVIFEIVQFWNLPRIFDLVWFPFFLRIHIFQNPHYCEVIFT